MTLGAEVPHFCVQLYNPRDHRLCPFPANVWEDAKTDCWHSLWLCHREPRSCRLWQVCSVLEERSERSHEYSTGICSRGVEEACWSVWQSQRIGDRVLPANKVECWKRTLADRWEDTVYLVTGLNADSHTFKIQNSSTWQEKTVHRNLIMPVNFIPLPHAAVDDETSIYTVFYTIYCILPMPHAIAHPYIYMYIFYTSLYICVYLCV